MSNGVETTLNACNVGCGGLTANNGSFYGTTYYGGNNGSGTVFMLTPSSNGEVWTETILYNFCTQANCFDGSNPIDNTGLLIGKSGAIYGTTYTGGAGRGTVFKLTPTNGGGSWTETILHSFTGIPDGLLANAGLLANQGVLYGTTSRGGIVGGVGNELGFGTS